MPDLKELVSKNVKELRLRKDLTQQDLADRTALNIRYISRLENNPQNITLDHLQLLADGLSVPPARLLSKDGNIEVTQPDLLEDLDSVISDLKSIKSRIKVK